MSVLADLLTALRADQLEIVDLTAARQPAGSVA